MSEIHRWRSGTGDPLLAASWDSAVAPGVAATRDLTFTGAAADGDTVTISGIQYLFKTTINNGNPREVTRGATSTDSATNLAAAINAGAGAGTLYSTATTAHKTLVSSTTAVIASNPTSPVVRAEALSLGTLGNSITASESCANASWGGSGFTGGVKNWSNCAIVLFDGVSSIDCQGTDRLDEISFLLRETEDNIAGIGSPSVPFRWNQTVVVGYEHILNGAGDLHLKQGSVFSVDGVSFFRIVREGSGVKFYSSPNYVLVEEGEVILDPGTGVTHGVILVDGLDTHVIVDSGVQSLLWCRMGMVDWNSSEASNGTWHIHGGDLRVHSRLSDAFVDVMAGNFIYTPDSAPLANDNSFYVVSGGVLDLSETIYAVYGTSVVRPGGEIVGGVVNPRLVAIGLPPP